MTNAGLRTHAMFVKIIDSASAASASGSSERERESGAMLAIGEARCRWRRRPGSPAKTATMTTNSNSTTSMVVNGVVIGDGEDVIVTLRRERTSCFVSLDEIVFDAACDDVSFDIFGTTKDQRWATGELKRDARTGEFVMTMTQAKLYGNTMSTEGERAPKHVSDLTLEFTLIAEDAEGGRRCLTSRVALSRASLVAKRTVLGETSAILPVIDEHGDHGYNGVINALKERSKFIWGAASSGNDFNNLAILSRMRQSYTSMLDHDEYPIDHSKLTWFDASLRLGVGVGLGAVLGLGLGVGVLANGWRSVRTLGANPARGKGDL